MENRLSISELRQKPLVEDRLKAISAQLIAAHRRQLHDQVVPYARQAGLAVEGHSAQALFMKTIQVFHPDRLAVVWSRVERALAAGESQAVDEVSRLLEFHPDRNTGRRGAPAFDEDFGPDDEDSRGFSYTEDDFGYDFDGDVDLDDGEFGDGNGDFGDDGTFYSAVKQELFGNLELFPDAADLGRLEGELDLSDYDLHDLEGVEHCKGLTSLNLAMNNIDNVYPLKGLVKLEVLDLAENDLEDADWLGSLVNLRELDLSANEIDDVAFLDRLPRLQYVDLTGNPVRNKAVIARLEARGVIVIF